MADILPRDLPPAASVNPASAIIVDGGVDVVRATPIQLVDSATPLATQADAEAGTDNAKRLTPLRSKQAIDALALKTAFTLAASYGAGTAGGRLLKNALVTDMPFGAVGDGATDDTAAVASADASAYTLVGLPDGLYKTSTASSTFTGPFQGRGQIKDNANNKRAPWFSAVKSTPTAIGNWDSIETAFNGDLSKTHLAAEHRITGVATLGQPATGYRNNPEAAAFLFYGQNTSGWNQATNGNEGRTLGHVWFIKVDNYGQGDYAGITFSAFVSGAKAGATNWLASPAATFINGTITAGQDGVFLNPVEIDLQLNGKDAAAVGYVSNINRTVGDTPGGLGAYTSGFRSQSKGTYAVDSAFSANGLFKVGLDLTPITLDANKAAISMLPNSRIYFNNPSSDGQKTTAYNGWWMEYNSTLGGMQFVANGASVMQIVAGQVTLTKPLVPPTTTTSQLPTAGSGNRGMEYYVSDANATTRMSVLVGGGANYVKVFSDGANWLIA